MKPAVSVADMENLPLWRRRINIINSMPQVDSLYADYELQKARSRGDNSGGRVPC